MIQKRNCKMIRVTVWYEYVQEAGEFNEEFLPKTCL